MDLIYRLKPALCRNRDVLFNFKIKGIDFFLLVNYVNFVSGGRFSASVESNSDLIHSVWNEDGTPKNLSVQKSQSSVHTYFDE